MPTAGRRDVLPAVVILLLFLGASTQFRVQAGPVSFAIVEPILVALVGVLVALEVRSRGRWTIEWKWPVILAVSIVLWAAVVRPWAPDRRHGLSDVRDWVLPAGAFVALLASSRLQWKPGAYGLLAAVLISGTVGLIQHAAGLPGPFAAPGAANKESYELLSGEGGTGESASPDQPQPIPSDPQSSLGECLTPSPDAFGGPWAEVSAKPSAPETIETPGEGSQGIVAPGRIFPAMALFVHPNNAAPFFLLGVFMAAAMAARAAGKATRAAWFLVSLSLAFALLWTYAEASILVGAALLPLGIVLYLIRPTRTSFPILAGLAAVGLAGVLLVIRWMAVSPPENLCWRMGLWGSAIATITANPRILLVGNGLDLYPFNAYYWHPHNLFLDMLLDYGVIGVLWTGALLGMIVYLGVRAWRSHWFRQEPVLLALWLGLLTYCFVGMAESVLLGIEGRTLFLGVLACFLGLFRELRRVPPPTRERDPTTTSIPSVETKIKMTAHTKTENGR